MFLTLTDADNGCPCEVKASAVLAIRIYDRTRTSIILAGGETIEVRESAMKVRELVEMVEFIAAGGRAPTRRAEGG